MAAASRRAADAGRARRVLRRRRHASHDAARELPALLRRRCRRTRTRCRSARPRSARSRPSTRSRRPDAEHARDRDAADRQDADDRGLLLQALDRPAVHLPAEPARLLRELPAHDVRDAVRGVRGRSGPGEGASTCCSSCTPITSRTARRAPCASSAARTRTCSPASRPASARCGARSTAAPTSK